jgi:hypothetical protein
VPEALLGDDRDDLRAPAAQPRVLLDGDTSRLVRFTDSMTVAVSSGTSERRSITSAEMPELVELVGGLHGARHHRGERDDGDVAARPDRGRDPELVDDLAVGHLALGRVERLLLEEQHRVGVADRRGEQPITSLGLDGATTFSPGIAIAQFSTAWECCAPKRSPPPLAVRITSGR